MDSKKEINSEFEKKSMNKMNINKFNFKITIYIHKKNLNFFNSIVRPKKIEITSF